jgi:hypothetical protein
METTYFFRRDPHHPDTFEVRAFTANGGELLAAAGGFQAEEECRAWAAQHRASGGYEWKELRFDAEP